MTQYSDSAALNGKTLTSGYFYTADSSGAGAVSSNGAISYSGTVTAGAPADISGTIASSGNGYFTVTSPTGVVTNYQVLGTTVDGNNLVFEAAQSQGSNTGPYYIISGTGASPGAAALDYNSNNPYQAPEPVCFAAGTLIATVEGEVPVESLVVGDIVVTASGNRRPVRWIGSAQIHTAAAKRSDDVMPVEIKRGALGDNVPSRDLLISPGHRMLIDGLLFQAESLVNDMTIVRKPVATIDYHHVELDEPDALLANGAAAESFIDVGNRASFNDAIGLPSAAALIDGDPLTETFAPNIKHGPKLEAVRAKLVERALGMGWSRRIDPSIALKIGERQIEAAASVGDRHWFILPDAADEIVVVSSAAVCSSIKPQSGDDRRLGVQILAVSADGRDVHLHSPAFASGFHECEEDGNRLFRWTDGNATLRLRKPAGVVEIQVGRGAELIVAIGAGTPIALAA